jgi:hypothetical protein
MFRLLGKKINYETFTKSIEKEVIELGKQKEELILMLDNLVRDYVDNKVDLLGTFEEVMNNMSKISNQTGKIKALNKALSDILGKEVE